MACDDAYITFRFADNVFNGHGLRWNPDSPPCEGYTNLSYVLAIAGMAAFGVQPVTAALVLATLAILGFVALALACSKRADEWKMLALLPAFLPFASGDLRVHASRGLETVAFATIACWHVYTVSLLVRRPLPTRRSQVVAAISGTLLFLTRPDGVLVSSVCWIVAFTSVRRDALRRGSLLAAMAFWLLSGAFYAAWKMFEFGYLLPNSFYMKHGDDDFAGILPTLAFAYDYWPLLATSASTILIARMDRREREATYCDVAPLATLLIAVPWLLYGAKIVHEIGFSHRFCWPLVPLLALGSIRALAAIPMPDLGRWTGVAQISLFLVCLAHVAPEQVSALRHLHKPPPSDPYTSTFLRLGHAIHESGLSDQIYLYCSHAGATPFAAKAHHVDPAGLVDDGYCRRTAPQDRARYEANLRWDVIDWNLFPASAGATSFESDSRAMGSRYLNDWVLGLDPGMDAAIRVAQARTGLDQRRASAFAYMQILRDFATLVGEMNTNRPRWRSFVYVWKASPHHDRLVAHLRSRVDIPAEQIDFVGWPIPMNDAGLSPK